METKCPHTPKCGAGYCWADEKPKPSPIEKPREWWIVEQDIYDFEDYGAVYPGDTKYKDGAIRVIEAAPALAALTAAESALLDASYALTDGSPAKRQVVEALALVRETLGVGPRWLDEKPKKG